MRKIQMLLNWEIVDPEIKLSRAKLFDGLIIFHCYLDGNGSWESLVFGAENSEEYFGQYFKTETEAKQAAERWLRRKITELKKG